jgi:8-oxo-dGTP pyrophosphatase MutT (NUDIX family)
VKNASLALIFRSNYREILLVKRQDVPVWVLPGGGIDPEETPEEAVLREVCEETGLKTQICRKTGLYTPINRFARLTHVFECISIDGTPTIGPETAEVRYFPINDLPPLIFQLHKSWLQDALENPHGVTHKPIDQVTIGALIKFVCRHPVIFLKYCFTRLAGT